MLLFIVLIIMLAIVTTIAVLSLSIGGAAFVIIFGDMIVCAMLIAWLIKQIFKKKK